MAWCFGGNNGAKPLPQSAEQAHTASELVAAIANGQDRAAFTELYRLYAAKLKGFAIRMGIDAGTADEVVQEILLTVWRRAATYDSTKATVSTWIYTIARNRVIDRKRRRRWVEVDPNDPALVVAEHPEHDQRIDAERRAERLRAAIQTLPADQADVLRVAYFQGKSQAAIAAEQNVPLGTVKSRTRLALARLRDALKDGP